MIPGVIPDKCRLTVSSLVDNQALAQEGIRGAILSQHRNALAHRIVADLHESRQHGQYATELRTDVYVFTLGQLTDFLHEVRRTSGW